MSARFSWRAGPIARLSLGLVALMVSLLVVLDLIFGVIPDRQNTERVLRQRFAESLAVQIASLSESSDERTLGKTLQQVVARNPDVHSIAVREASGYVVAQRGDHARYWVAPETGRSTLNHLRVPIQADRQLWGDLEIAFVSVTPNNVREWLTQPTVLLVGTLSIGGLLAFYPYLRHALSTLDPSTAIPDRVRKAFDALEDGVVVVDPDGRIMLANASFRRFLPEGVAELHGRRLSDVAWQQSAEARDGDTLPPWNRVFRDRQPVSGYHLSIAQPVGEPMQMIVGCSPIADDGDRVRGCLVNFHDVSEIHRANEELRRTLVDLEQSREKIQAQNEELIVLATRDPLTGCLNRRAFFGSAGGLVDNRLQTNRELSCIMTDIDRFKTFNDLYGHSVGDQVLQVVSRTLSRNMRAEDLLCRYGGEEFCIVLPDTDLVQAQAIAERMRNDIETHALEAIRSTRIERITSSFGVASLSQGALRIEELIDQADNALYKSKEGGRNRVTAWQQQDE